jgi:ribosomal protein S18 acetylase RimI-like enzyme
MISHPRSIIVERLPQTDSVAVAQTIVLDVDSFPTPTNALLDVHPFERVFVARVPPEARVVGFALARWQRYEAYIERFAVDRQCQRQGIGRSLLRSVIGAADAEAVKALALHVSVSNAAAVALYRAEGFRVGSLARAFYRSGLFDRDGDAYEMRMLLTQWPEGIAGYGKPGTGPCVGQ